MLQPVSQTHAPLAQSLRDAFAPLRVSELPAEPLRRGSEAEARAFLAERRVHAVNLLGLIRDNGLESPHNRGSFYGCRDERGRLEGVALVGHATLFEARTPRALRSLARAAQSAVGLHMLLGEAEPVAGFWRHYRAGGRQPMRLACRELLFQLDRADADDAYYDGDGGAEEGPRPATREDLALVVPVQAAMAEEESGVNPLAGDPDGFRLRCERRVALGRTWVLTDAGRLVFKAEVVADAEGVVYLEGVHLDAFERGRGRALRCLSRLTAGLLRRADTICLLVNERNAHAQSLYLRAGFRLAGHYDTIFLRRD